MFGMATVSAFRARETILGGKSTRTAINGEIKRARNELEAFIAESNNAVEQQIQSLADKSAEASADTKAETDKVIQANHVAQNDLAKSIAGLRQAMIDWTTVIETHREKLRIAHARELWEKRAEEHRATAWKFAGAGAAFMLIALMAVVLGAPKVNQIGLSFAFAPQDAATTAAPDLSALIKVYIGFLAATGLLFVTFCIWIVRIIVRNYNGNIHMANDASVRAAAAQTYLSMADQGTKMDDALAVLVSTLFRPAADGLVNDDGMPTLTPAAFLTNPGKS